MHQLTNEVISQSDKILIIGSPGSGKTFFSNQLAKSFHYDVYHWDDLYWDTGWERASEDEIITKIKEILMKPRWILEGNYFHYVYKERLIVADAVILVSAPPFLCFLRVIIRYFKILFGNDLVLPANVRNDSGSRRQKTHFDFKFLKFVICFKKNTLPYMLNQMQPFADKVYIITKKTMRQISKIS